MSHNIPSDLIYTSDHEWAKIDGDIAAIGITDFAQNALGDIVFVELPQVGTTLGQGATFGVVESIKSVSDLFAPLEGEVIEVNSGLEGSPEEINQNPYDSWIIKVKLSNPDQVKSLLSAAQYTEVVEAQ
ncbi:MAG: glycine cleavage system protein H [Bdellovibrionales bacterium CG12_big_fil_rev_8_21_14_0_65_38_15]|nr:MAG: glycine cleavage system protein H [Bdellovibrionales bacterium CG22_combo_CG10-13_8_21_14_all_38_13]PIQ57278.1 MAG: glycine cleavage system protein H [Bdellovibrionales bacterium CG12_big_fil_rev_8_21_14_0_65_38_15]PIR29684.1 MAG: glycine cleavage system protein H [Bdellovibrionales bacterium CG11_big_fil_rev_8_21_14_0_20_38_13]